MKLQIKRLDSLHFFLIRSKIISIEIDNFDKRRLQVLYRGSKLKNMKWGYKNEQFIRRNE